MSTPSLSLHGICPRAVCRQGRANVLSHVDGLVLVACVRFQCAQPRFANRAAWHVLAACTFRVRRGTHAACADRNAVCDMIICLPEMAPPARWKAQHTPCAAARGPALASLLVKPRMVHSVEQAITHLDRQASSPDAGHPWLAARWLPFLPVFTTLGIP